MDGEEQQPPHEANVEPVVSSEASEPVPRVLSGDPQNLSDVDAFNLLLEMKLKRRRQQPNLPPPRCQLWLKMEAGCSVVDRPTSAMTARRDVVKTIREVQPDVVVVELCQYRVSMLKMDESTLLREAQELSLEKLQQAVRQNGLMSGLMQMLLLKVSAHITEQLGMAPGGEFREAFKEASKVPFCKFHLGDRPIPVTFKRAIAALSFWQKVRLAWGLCFLSDPISKDDVERCKQKDLLEQMMAEMIGEFPDLHRTIVSERDVYLTYMLRQAARRLELPRASDAEPRKCVPSVVVGVVGMGPASPRWRLSPGRPTAGGGDPDLGLQCGEPTPARPSTPSLPQRAPAIHLRQSVSVGCEGCLLRSAGLQRVLDGPPHCQSGPVAARHAVLPAEGDRGPAQVGDCSLPARAPEEPVPPWHFLGTS
ncbi:PREDICTED: traB domain-containing protein isoform X2 [Rhinopithecus bieti]|nr:PREDICTED: traB domain-containing protein isoform X2 [Rhinopithecus bieti]XP_017743562.1 PREDICTED: traB domain-containing protein isoform X2 [Rhinopithecus bieti]XP_017743563.1 PREDICTED: traB domain-containing protein isoform X2 [Rhinopithecus bieti]XP_017743564.1 PREDICTED: traB domain-containing protein isoform X2 [Rhinopithecus bieti]XP_017743565.1 PREDICTED: traB domain-containing protein isoform X2 [Rhinopithecus bieti]